MRPVAVIRHPGERPLTGAEADDQGTKSASGVAMPYLNSRTCSFTLAPVEAGLSPAGTSCCRGRASILLRGTEAPQRAARRRALRGHGVGVRTGAVAIQPGGRVA